MHEASLLKDAAQGRNQLVVEVHHKVKFVKSIAHTVLRLWHVSCGRLTERLRVPSLMKMSPEIPRDEDGMGVHAAVFV